VKWRSKQLVIAAVGGFAASFVVGPAQAGPDDVNPVFAPMAELPRAGLDAARGRGAGDLVLNSSLTVNGVSPEAGGEDGAPASGFGSLPAVNGDNSIAAGAFSSSEVFAAIVQNNGSFVNIQNLMVVNVKMDN